MTDATPELDRSTPMDVPEHVACAFCDGTDTELLSLFGTALSVATYWCRDCHTAFEWVKWDERRPRPGPERGEAPA